LPERDRRVLLAREVDGLSYAEMADALELPGGQVGMILKRSRERLQRGIGAALAGLPEMEADADDEPGLEQPPRTAHDRDVDAPGPDGEREAGA
jgi:hypothetical protein